jgi:Flp pilus assembly protein TadD
VTRPPGGPLASTPQQLFALAAQHIAQGRLPEAEAAYRQLLQKDPPHIKAHINLGVVLRRLGRPDEALAEYRRALELAPGDPEALTNMGNLLREHRHAAHAERCYRDALAARPEHVPAWLGLGLTLAEQGQPAPAEAALRQALALSPNHVEAWVNLGKVLQQAQRFDEACAAYERAVALQPAHADAWSHLGYVLQCLGRFAEAHGAHGQAVRLQPGDPRIHNHRGMALAADRQWAAAEAAYREALRLAPAHAEAWNNLGALYQITGRSDEAEQALRQALAAHPAYTEARANLGTLLLALGRYEEAWPPYRARHALADNPGHARPPNWPEWTGDALAGRSIVLWPEQGFGDCLQFVRYAGLLKARGAGRITLVCPPVLATLLATAPGIDAVHADAAPPPHDLWCRLLDLPMHLGTTLATIPAALPYLAPSARAAAAWQERLQGIPATRVGLVWKGSAGHKNDANRSLPSLAALAPLWAVPGITFVSLQKGNGEDEAREPPQAQPLIDAGSRCDDFDDAAGAVRALDLVITVDTATAHLAGALAVPAWVLLPAHGTDWRWLQGREDSPWYPGVMRLFRQQQAGAWEPVVARLAAALREWARPPWNPGGRDAAAWA